MSKRKKAIKNFLFQDTKEDTIISVDDIMKNINFDVPQIEPKTIYKKSRIKTPIKITILLTSYILVFLMAIFITRTKEDEYNYFEFDKTYEMYSVYYFKNKKIEVCYINDDYKIKYYVCNSTGSDITLKYNDELVLLKNSEKFLIAIFTIDDINKIEFDLIYDGEIRHGVIG